MSDRTIVLDAALRYAATGWPVFLLGRTKRPIVNCAACPTRASGHGHDPESCSCLTCHGFYAATVESDRIRAMCTAHPRGMLAIRTGTASGLLALDVDPRNGGQVNPNLMPRTACVATGGGGWHLLYRHPGGPVGAKLAGHAGVDIKADGGYVVAPPSVHPITRRRYVWLDVYPVVEMPPPLVSACRPVTATQPSRIEASADGSTPATLRRAGGISSPDRLLAAHLDAVARAAEGQRRVTLYGAARGVARMVAAGAITEVDAWAVLTQAGQQAEQTDRDIRAAILGGFRAEGLAA